MRPVLATLLLLATTAAVAQSPRTIENFNDNWAFFKGDAAGAEQSPFDDSGWRKLSVPHDWAIEGSFDQKAPEGQGGGFLPTGVGWYRKHFTLPAAEANRHVFIVFDGVMENSDVWINGVLLGHRPSGYVSFFYDLTGHLQTGTNVVAVRADNSKQPDSRWYAGAGIYRSVRLVVLNDVHTTPWSTVVTTPKVAAASATVHLETTVKNEAAAPAQAEVVFSLISPDGRALKVPATAAREIAGKAEVRFMAEVTVPNPALWNLDRPAMYQATAEVRAGRKVLDNDTVAFGIREFHFDADTGFWLNGKNFKIKGAALHGDMGALGVAVPVAAYARRLNELRALGINAIRTAHNPPSPEFLDLADRMGFLVMDEMFDCWTVAKNPFDYHLFFNEWSITDERDTVRRDRNHPSIILWSAGNEIHDTPNQALANKILTGLVQTFHENDPTRPVTQALFRPNVSHDYDNGLADLLDVVGQNYRENELLAAHAQKPTRKIVGTENTHDRPVWLAMRDHAPYSGQFLWVGADYLGESGAWPRTTNGAGLIDRTGLPHPRGLERESWWSTEPNVHIVRRVSPTERAAIDPGYEIVAPRFQQSLYRDWNPINPADHTENVEVYTNAEEVDLQLNGKSLGRQPLHADASPLTWKVPYAPGTLTATAYAHGKEVAKDVLRTAGKAARIQLTAERTSFTANPADVVYLDATVVDEAGNVVPDAAIELHFALTGPARIAGVDNGDTSSHDLSQAETRHAFEGRAVVIVAANAPGAVTVTVSATGLEPGKASLGVSASASPRVPSRSF